MIKFYEEHAEYIPEEGNPGTWIPSGKAALTKIGGKKSLLKFLRELQGPYTFRPSYSECGKKRAVEILGDCGLITVIAW